MCVGSKTVQGKKIIASLHHSAVCPVNVATKQPCAQGVGFYRHAIRFQEFFVAFKSFHSLFVTSRKPCIFFSEAQRLVYESFSAARNYPCVIAKAFHTRVFKEARHYDYFSAFQRRLLYYRNGTLRRNIVYPLSDKRHLVNNVAQEHPRPYRFFTIITAACSFFSEIIESFFETFQEIPFHIPVEHRKNFAQISFLLHFHICKYTTLNFVIAVPADIMPVFC